MYKIHRKIIHAALLFIPFILVFALKVAPGSFTTQYIPIGHPQDLGFSLTCSDVGAKYAIVKVMSPEIQTPLCDGYMALPDTSWFKIGDSETLFVDSSDYARSKIWTDIPLREELYNQHFDVKVFISANSNGMFQSAIISNYFIETEPKANPSKPPLGELGVAPSILECDIKNTTGVFTVFNNDTLSHNYEIAVRIPVRRSQKFPNISPGFDAISNTGLLSVSPSNFKLVSHSKIQISLRLISAASFEKSTEAILFITADNGIKNFVRVKFEVGE
ncbi:hypothetical protein J7L68_09480 [bacterium]|nr:hypothetical protein [bacterium]